jgi:pSer/pThr/pTyr-binding forkhead associated (FHA) protein
VALRLEVTALDDPQARAFRYEFDADRAQILLGRRGGVDVLLPNAKVSLVHARIERRGEDYYVVDDGSTNGTRLNGMPLGAGQRALLKDGDRLGIGIFTLHVALVEAEANNSGELAAATARRMVREVLERLGPGATQPSLLVLDGPQAGTMLTLGEPGRAYILGRGEGSDLRLDDVDMWREHAALVRDDQGVTVRDLGVTTGLMVNSLPVDGERRLQHGDTIRLGSTILRYTDPAEVYLRKLDASSTPEENTQSVERPRRGPDARRPELALAALGIAVALLAVAGLVYVLAW